MKPAVFSSAEDFQSWLGKNHDTAVELLVGFRKSGPPPRGLTYPEALDAALAFGWIDGVRKRIDDDAYSIRFTPRRPGSIWSAVNIRRVHELISQGRMQPSGLAAFEARDERKTRRYSYEREHLQLDPALDAALRANPGACAFFEAQPPGYRKIAIFWIMSARKEETRVRRMAHLIHHSAEGTRIDLLRPGDGGPGAQSAGR